VSATRRAFLARSAATSAALLLSFDLPELRAASASAADFEPNAFLGIASDGTVTLWVIRLEMGQGVRTVLPMVLCEELDADWDRVRVEQATPGGRFEGIRLHTSGSSSSSETYATLRRAGAAAREMLVAAAAAAWGVAPEACRTERSAVVHRPSGRRLTYGNLASSAARLPVPAEPHLKDPQTFRILGRPMRRVGGPAIVTGAARYGLDVRVPGMLYASIERAPTMGGSLRRFDGAAALARPGVRHVLPVKAGIHEGVAVVASDTWSAIRGRDALKVEWEPGPQESFDSEEFLADLPKALEHATFKVRHEGDAPAAIARSAKRHEATYVFPFQAHAPLETMNCTADVRPGSAELWVPTQTDVRTLQQATKLTGLPAEKIRLHCQLMGGGFGRRLFADFVAEAVAISKAIGKPVQLMWTREDDMRCGYFQPATAEHFRAGLDGQGRLTGLVHRTSASDLTIYDIHEGRNIWHGPPPEPRAPDRYERDQSPWGAYDNPYEIASLKVDCADVTSPVPTGPWRAVEYPSTVFGRESFLDELAHETGQDPLAFRLGLLGRGVRTVGPYRIDQGRLRRVLEEVGARSEWGRPLATAPGRLCGRGVAANVYHAHSYVAMVAEVSVARDLSDVRVDRVVAVVDCGRALNPLGIEGQTESGITWGLSATLLGKMDFRQGRATKSNFGDFEVLRIDRMPRVEIHILPSSEPPGGFGEHPVPTVAPAVANAVFQATGRRVRHLPVTPEELSCAEPTG
jgi:isoquinoline 1-oxidoreductase beta subunit